LIFQALWNFSLTFINDFLLAALWTKGV
jgi:hypothetical protein